MKGEKLWRWLGHRGIIFAASSALSLLLPLPRAVSYRVPIAPDSCRPQP